MEPDQTAPCLQKESKLDLAVMFRGMVYSTLSYTYSCVAYIILKYKDILFRWLSDPIHLLVLTRFKNPKK